MRKSISAVSESGVVVDTSKEFEKAAKLFREIKKGTKVKLLTDVYYGALDYKNKELSIKDATGKFGLKVGNDYGDGTGEYIIPKGTILNFEKSYGNGTAPTFKIKDLDIEFEHIDDISFEVDSKDYSFDEVVKHIQLVLDIDVSDKSINYSSFYKDIANVLDKNKAIVDYNFNGSQKLL